MSKIRIIPEIEFDDETELTGNNDKMMGNNDEMTGNNDSDETDINNEMEVDDETAGISDEMSPLSDLLTERLPERNYIFLTKKLPINESEKSQFVKKGKISD